MQRVQERGEIHIAIMAITMIGIQSEPKCAQPLVCAVAALFVMQPNLLFKFADRMRRASLCWQRGKSVVFIHERIPCGEMRVG